MGLLDDAIREHLDLKRRRGGDPEEIERLEQEALGPVRREPPVAYASDEDYQDQRASPDAGRYSATAGSAAMTGPEGPGATPQDPFDDDYEDEFFDEQPTQMHRTSVDEQPEEEHSHRRFGIFGRKSAHEKPREVEDPREQELIEESLQADEPEEDDPFAPADRTPVAEEQSAPPLNFEEPEAAAPPPRRPRFPGASDEQRREQPEYRDAHDDDDADDGLPAASTAETGPRDEPQWDEKTQIFSGEEADAQEPGDEDVLEETPEFLQDTPDHDRLWFEQKPPRDFDFDG